MSQLTQVEADVEATFDFLVGNGPYRGDSYTLAKAIGITYNRLQAALGRIRRQTEENGWTIPFVRRGMGDQVYAVVPVDGPTPQEGEVLLDGLDRQAGTVITMLDNVRQQAVILKAITTPRTAERKWANQLLSTTSYLVEQGHLLLEEQKERVAIRNGSTV